MRVWSAERVWVRGRFEQDWALMVDEKGIIQASGPRKQLVARASHVNHYAQSAILPLWVNPHHQGFHQLFKGMAGQAKNYRDYQESLVYPFTKILDEDRFDCTYRVAFAEQVRAGVGAIGEFHYLHHAGLAAKGTTAAERIIAIAQEMGIRLTLIYALFDQGNAEKTKAFIEPLDESIRNFVRLHETFKEHPTIRVLPGVHSLTHTSAEAIVAASDLARKFHTPLHIQLGACEEDAAEAQVQYGTTPVGALERMGLLKPGLVVVHGNHLEPDEWTLLKKAGAGLVSCPGATLAKGERLPDYLEIFDLDIPMTFGSEMSSLNPSFSPAAEMMLAEHQLRRSKNQLEVFARRAPGMLFEFLTSMPAAMLGNREGGLMPGRPADFLCLSLAGPSYRPRWNFHLPTFQSMLLANWSQARVTQVFVHGSEIYSDPAYRTDKLERSYSVLDEWSAAFIQGQQQAEAAEGKGEEEPARDAAAQG